MICSKGFAQLELLGKHVETFHSNKQPKIQSPIEKVEKRKSVRKNKLDPIPDEKQMKHDSNDEIGTAGKI